MPQQTDDVGEIRVEWDETKNVLNQLKPGISFAEAAHVFTAPLSLTVPDDEPSFNHSVIIF